MFIRIGLGELLLKDAQLRESSFKHDALALREASDRACSVAFGVEVERELQTVRPNSDAPSRSGVTPTGTGADSQRG